MLIIGIILAAAGAGSLIYGITQNNSASAQLSSLLGSGSTNPGTVYIVIGVIAVVIGIILLTMGLKNRNQ